MALRLFLGEVKNTLNSVCTPLEANLRTKQKGLEKDKE